MIHYNHFIMAKSLDEAYELNRKKSAVICGGFCWLRLQNRTVQTMIDLSGLGLDQIEETEEGFEIGSMVSLRQLETHNGFQAWTRGAGADSLRHIVGTQFRNCATVGGSIYGRFGFSDVLTLFLALDAQVKLFKGGVLPLREFLDQKEDGDILISVLVKKGQAFVSYESMRNEAVDFPVLTASVCLREGQFTVSVGARPGKARVYSVPAAELSGEAAQRDQAVKALTEKFAYGTNMRASAEYRKYLASILVSRCLNRIEADRKGEMSWN